MISYRITKYDPKERDERGSYENKNEWTSISDIGRPQYGATSFEAYEKVERAYIEAIKLILISHEIDTVTVDSIEKWERKEQLEAFRSTNVFRNLHFNFETDIQPLGNGLEIRLGEIDQVVKLILREIVWMNLVGAKGNITFGYDYYMYVECAALQCSTITAIQKLGLFVEAGIGPRRIIVDGGPALE